MKTMIAILVVLMAVPQADPRSPTKDDMRRFVMFAVFEGLWEDGADPAVIAELRKKPFEYFIPKCSICDAVRQGMDVYLAAPKAGLGDAKGAGLPKEIADGLKNPDRAARLDGIRRLTERYVTRRFDRSKMTEEYRNQMEVQLQGARKEGMTVKEDSFGTYCPSCDGALKIRPKK